MFGTSKSGGPPVALCVCVGTLINVRYTVSRVDASRRRLARAHYPGAEHPTPTLNEVPFDSQRCYSRAARAAAFMLDTASVDVGGLRVLFSSNFWNPSLSTVNITSSSPRPEIPRSSDTT